VAAHLGSEVAVTPVRRSARLGLTPGGSTAEETLLKGANYAFLPNAALLQPGAGEASHALFDEDDFGGEAAQEGDEAATTAVEDVCVRRVSAVLRRQMSNRSSCSAASADSAGDAAGGDAAPAAGRPAHNGMLYMCDSADEESDVDVHPAAVRRCGSPLVLNRGGGGSSDSLFIPGDLELDDPTSVASLRRLRFSASVTAPPPPAAHAAATGVAATAAPAAMNDADGEISPLSVFARVMAGLLTATIAATSKDANPPDGQAALEQVHLGAPPGPGPPRRGRSAVKSPQPARRRSSSSIAAGLASPPQERGRPPRRGGRGEALR
jgi:hypothetical protein